MFGFGRSATFLLLALLAEVAGTVGGFGSSVFFVPIAGFYFDFHSVLGITALFHLASNVSKLALFRGGIDRGLLLRLGVPSVLFAVLGGLATTRLQVHWLEAGLAVFLLGSSGWMLLRPHWRIAPTNANTLVGGALSGGMAGLVGTGGAVRGMTLAAFDLRKDVFIATSAAIDLGIDLGRTAVYAYNGYLHRDDLPWVPILAVVALAGTWLGRRILTRIPQAMFRRVALVLVFGIGLITVYRVLA